MILKYVLKNFSRRKVRTILMILSLLISTGLIVTMSATVQTMRQSNVDLIASASGRYDLAVSKMDTSPQPFIQIEETAVTIAAANDRITAVYPRFQTDIEFNAGGDIGRGTLLALDPVNDDIGYIDVVTGTYTLGNDQVAILEDTAYNYSLNVGDEIDISYSFPLPREEGKPNTSGASERRTTHRFTVGSIVRQDGVANSEFRTGIIVALADVQAWLGLPGQAQTLIATVDPALYETNNAEVAALRMRNITRDVQTRLGDDYTYTMDKATFLDQTAQGFMAAMALINVYGLMALGVVGLLVHTLVMTNVQEQKRDMAVLRILGGQRNFLFILVITEVLVIGAIGVSLGVVLGQLITQYIAVPLIQNQLAAQGLTTPLTPRVSVAAVLPAIISAFVVLIISSVKPAQEAARTKVMHAINPGVADNIQIEDLAKLRERSPNGRLFLSGVGLMFIFLLIAGFQTIEVFGGPALQVSFYLLALGMLILGLGLMFFITTVPFERLVLLAMRSIFPKVTYFARRNVGRGSLRNTLISLLVLFSGVLPSFLATQMALDNANFETTTRLNMGAPVSIRVFQRWDALDDISASRLKPSFLTNDLAAVPGIDQSVGLTYEYYNRASDAVGMRAASVGVIGIDGRLNDVLFSEMMEFTAGGTVSLDRILEEPNTIVISEGLAEYLAVSLGDSIKITGEGQDNVMTMQVVGIARRMPGFSDIVRSRTRAQGSSTVFMSLDSFRYLTTPLNDPLPPHDDPVFSRVLTTLTPEAVPEEVSREIGERFGTTYSMWTQLFETSLEMNAQAQATQRVFLLILTVISFTTAVFGVFAVIYVTIYARRIEIGMMKAMGMRRRDLTGMLIVEAITMTLGAALAGIAAGAAMGYVSYWGDRVLQERPMIFAVDTTVMPFIVIMVVLASILGAAFSARRIVKKRAVEILRMQ
jgi:ABC-type antimicrobial peptide transport system permease subunit